MLVSDQFVHLQCGRLREALAAPGGPGALQCTYGFVVHPRRELEGAVFGVLTAGGETLPLTRRMLERLPLECCRLVDGTEIAIAAEPSVWGKPDDPVDELRITFFRRQPRSGEVVAVAWTSRAADLPQPALVLATGRPVGWPT